MIITVQELFAVDRLFEKEYRENILYSARIEVLVCRELQSINIRSTNSLLNNPVYKNIVYIKYIFYTNWIQNIDNRDNIIDYIDYSQTDSSKSWIRNSIDIESIQISCKSDISQNTEINSVSIDFYRVVAVKIQIREII